MLDHPEREKELPKKKTPGLIAVVDRVGDASHNSNKIEDQNSCRGDQERRPFQNVQLPKAFIVCLFGGYCKIRVNTGENLQQPLEKRE